MDPGKPFVVRETGWGEFEIAIKLYYVAESGEKPQTLYHHLRLHPYGRSDAEKEAMRATGEVIAWMYDEQLFNEPYDAFYEILTSGALSAPRGGKGKGKGKGAAPQRSEGGILPRSAMIPLSSRPGHPFSRDTEQLEIKRLKDATAKAHEMIAKMSKELKVKEQRITELKKESGAVAG
jgi:YEATS domain-containing protein 4